MKLNFVNLLSHLFKNGCPGRDWFYEFKKRWRHKLEGLEESNPSRSQSVNAHPSNEEPSSRHHHATSNTRETTSELSFGRHYQQLDANHYFKNILLKQYSTFDFSSHPENVWTVNETSLTLNCNFDDPSNILFFKKPIKSCQPVFVNFYLFLLNKRINF